MIRGHGGRVVTLSPLRLEFDSCPDLKWEVWELLAVGRQFIVQNLDQLYILVSSGQKTNRCDMTCTMC